MRSEQAVTAPSDHRTPINGTDMCMPSYPRMERSGRERAARTEAMVKFLLFCILFVLCWPLALVALALYPLVWLLLLPFRVVGIAVGGVLELVSAIITLPARVIRAL